MFVLDSEGRSVVAGAKVALSGPSTVEAESDQDGKCVFINVAPGTYKIQAQFPGLEAAEAVTVEAGKTTQFPLQLKPTAVQSSITVTATNRKSRHQPPTRPSQRKRFETPPTKMTAWRMFCRWFRAWFADRTAAST